MRIIDADKLKAHYAWWANGDKDAQDNKRIFDSIVDTQPTLYLKAMPVWIDVDDHLPGKPESVFNIAGELVVVDQYIVMIEGAMVPTTLWWNGNDWLDEHGEPYNVTHWMPLPEVPHDT